MMKPIRIAYCIPALYYPSGMERVLSVKANYLAAHGYEVHIILTDGGGKPPYFPLDASIRLHQLDIDFEEPYRHSLWKRIWMYQCRMRILKLKLNKCLCSIRPDITVSLLRRDINVLNQMQDGSVKVGEIHFDRLHYRIFCYRLLPDCLNRFISKCWMASLLRRLRKLACFVVLTHEDATFWPELQDVRVIHNPLTISSSKIADVIAPQVIAAGRYVEQKGFDRLIDAWHLLASEFPDWKLRIYGDGHLRAALQRQIDTLGLSDSCILESSVPHIADKYAESSLFVLSSRFEGFGLVLVEAMACGLPVVSFACPCGPRDIITDGMNGYLVDEGDVAGLAERMRRLMSDAALRQRMGKSAVARSADFTIDKVGRQWTDLFEGLVKQYGRNKYVV